MIVNVTALVIVNVIAHTPMIDRVNEEKQMAEAAHKLAQRRV